MINPNGDDFMEHDPSAASMQSGEEETISGAKGRLRQTARRVSGVAGDTWSQARDKAGTVRERTELFLRKNPVPTVLGALMIGLAIGLAIRYASSSSEKEVEVKTPLGDAALSALSLPFLWPFFKTVKRKYQDSTEAVKEGVDRLKEVDVDRYVKPLRKRWKAWTN
jgi:ElaB/YqjD/DUF883 family membrane-anchored ribosome-binding protein